MSNNTLPRVVESSERVNFLVFILIAENFVKFNIKDECCGLRQYLCFDGVRCSRTGRMRSRHPDRVRAERGSR